MDQDFDKLMLQAFADNNLRCLKVSKEKKLEPIVILYKGNNEEFETYSARIMDRQLIYIGERGIQYNNMLS